MLKANSLGKLQIMSPYATILRYPNDLSLS